MFPELKNNIRSLIFLFIIGLILFGLYNDAQQKQKERVENKTKYGVESIANKDLIAVEKEVKWEVDHLEKSDFRVEKRREIFYFKIMNAPSKDPITMGYLDPYFATQIKEFQYKNYDIIIYIRR